MNFASIARNIQRFVGALPKQRLTRATAQTGSVTSRPAHSSIKIVTDSPKITYAPVKDGDADPGEIVWTWVPYEEDPQQGKDRPVLVIGSYGSDVAALMLTSKPHNRPDYLSIGSGSWDAQRRPSWIRLDRVMRLDPDSIRREGAVVPKDVFGRVVSAYETRRRG